MSLNWNSLCVYIIDAHCTPYLYIFLHRAELQKPKIEMYTRRMREGERHIHTHIEIIMKSSYRNESMLCLSPEQIFTAITWIRIDNNLKLKCGYILVVWALFWFAHIYFIVFGRFAHEYEYDCVCVHVCKLRTCKTKWLKIIPPC